MFTLDCYDEKNGIPIAKFINKKKSHLLCIKKEDENKSEESEESEDFKELELEGKSNFEPRLNPYQRSVVYIAGPSGSGKSTYAVNLIKPYIKFFDKPFYLFSRTDYKTDPAFKGLTPMQIPINDSLLINPIDITKELTGGSVVFFDDCNTIQNEKLRKVVQKMMEDILEVGRKLDITIIITSHLVIPSSREFARTVMNEIQTLTVFPKSGSSQQISYALQTYFGLKKSQIEEILQIKSRWVTISKSYPMYVLSNKLAYIL
jgi:hypothetical protein